MEIPSDVVVFILISLRLLVDQHSGDDGSGRTGKPQTGVSRGANLIQVLDGSPMSLLTGNRTQGIALRDGMRTAEGIALIPVQVAVLQ